MIDLSLPEGATPIEDISHLKPAWIKTRTQLNLVEAENIVEAYSKYFSISKEPQKWFTEKFLKQVHRDMFGKIWGWAGSYYKGPARNIGIDACHIPIQVCELCNDVLFWLENSTDLTVLEQ